MKKGFTLAEIIVAIVVISVGLVSLIGALQYATKLTTITKSQVIAINLAREGVEMMFNKRDTNRQMYSSKKDSCRLVNNLSATSNSCENASWLTYGNSINTIFSLTPATAGQNGEYYLADVANASTITGFLNDKFSPDTYPILSGTKLCLTASGWSNCATPATNNSTKYGRYRRYIWVQGLFLKDSVTATGGVNVASTCANGSTTASGSPCGDSRPKEVRFCSIVDYTFDAPRRVELCTSMTNFVE